MKRRCAAWRAEKWLTKEQARELLGVPDKTTLRGKRDYAILALLTGCALRRTEVASLTLETIQQREHRPVLADVRGKSNRAVAVSIRVKKAVEAWTEAAGIDDGYAAFFQEYDILLTHVVPVVAQRHGVTSLNIDGQVREVAYIQGATVPQNITGLPALSIRFGTSSDGLPIGVQLTSGWQAESTVLDVASLLEQHSPVRDLRPPI